MSAPTEMELVVGVDGAVRCIYDEALDLRALGKLRITRASHVEPDADGNWWADMGPSGGPVLGPFGTRGETLAAERGVAAAIGELNDKDKLPGPPARPSSRVKPGWRPRSASSAG